MAHPSDPTEIRRPAALTVEPGGDVGDDELLIDDEEFLEDDSK
jgi:hypothetical protein